MYLKLQQAAAATASKVLRWSVYYSTVQTTKVTKCWKQVSTGRQQMYFHATRNANRQTWHTSYIL